jgi:Na+/H+ antiporter NhaD/arsenite permease-like protein
MVVDGALFVFDKKRRNHVLKVFVNTDILAIAFAKMAPTDDAQLNQKKLFHLISLVFACTGIAALFHHYLHYQITVCLALGSFLTLQIDRAYEFLSNKLQTSRTRSQQMRKKQISQTTATQSEPKQKKKGKKSRGK